MSPRSLFVVVCALFSLPVFAHDGHGLLGAHWHGSDALGIGGLCVGVLVAAAVWLYKGGQ